MLARHQGRVVLVMGAIPGERVRARVVRARRDVLHATVTDVVEADRDRRSVDGDPGCGGQVYGHIAYRRQLVLKSQLVRDALTRIAKLPGIDDVSVTASPEHGYRMRARLHASRSGLGFLREGTHSVCDPEPTRQLQPETIRVVSSLGRRLVEASADRVIHVDLAENMAADQRVLHFHVRGEVAPETLADCTAETSCTGVTWAMHGAGETMILRGTPTVTDRVSEVIDGKDSGVLTRHAASFFQANRYLLPDLVRAVCRRVTIGPVLDLYAGVGLFGVALASLGVRGITAVERDRIAVSDLAVNAANGGRMIDVVRASSEAYLTGRSDPIPGTVIVDPPRTGLTRNVIDRLAALGTRLVYVSCDVATFARDLRRLSEVGYEVGDIDAYDMFPNTAHVELVTTLQK